MGKLTLRLYASSADGNVQAGHVLQQLRRLKATLVNSIVEEIGADAVEVYEFATTGLALPRASPRSPHLIRPIIEQQERVTRLEAIAQLGIGLAGPRSFPPSQRKEASMPTPLRRPLTLGKFEPDGRRLFELARRLVRGEGPPEELRMPNPVVTVVPRGQDIARRNAWGIAGIGVGLEMNRPYPPVEAMVVSGYILFGTEWPAAFKRLRIPASLAHAYVALEQHFDRGQHPLDTLVTIPKPIPPRTRPPVAAISSETPLTLAPPTRPQLTHEPESSTVLCTIDAAPTCGR